GEMSIAAGDQRKPQEIFFGAESVRGAATGRTYPIEVVAGFFFALVALGFVGLGQTMGQLFSAIPNRVAAYTTNIAGSLVGIATFAALSASRSPPRAWFAIALVPLVVFVTRFRILQILALAVIVYLVGWTPPSDPGQAKQVVWSPYYKVVYSAKTGV